VLADAGAGTGAARAVRIPQDQAGFAAAHHPPRVKGEPPEVPGPGVLLVLPDRFIDVVER
jgi:hypothetical protein